MQLATSSHSADEDNFEKMTSAYNACLDEPRIKKLGIQPLAEVADQIKKAFPLKTAVTHRPESALSDTLLLLAQYGVSSLVSIGTGADDADPDTVVVSVSPPWRIGLPSKERYEDDVLVKKYQNVTIEVLSLLSPELDKDILAGVTVFEKKLAAASPSTEDRQDATVRAHVPPLQRNVRCHPL
jgi:endothelin-converting enzyme